MKRILFILGIIFIVGFIALGIVISTVGVKAARPMIISRIESALGSRVELKDVSVVWRGGVAVALIGLKVYSHDNVTPEPDLSVEHAYAVVKLLPLLKRDIQITDITVKKPRVGIIRDEYGNISVKGINPKNNENARAPKAAAPLPAGSFFIQTLKIADGIVNYQDNTFLPPLDVVVQKLDVLLKDVSLDRPVGFDISMALSGKAPNIEGSLNLSFDGTAAGLEGPKISQTLSGKGEFDVTEAALVNIDIVRDTLGKITLIPGLGAMIDANLSSSLKEKLSRKHMPLKPFKNSFIIQDGQLTLVDLNIATDVLEVATDLRARLTGEVQGQGTLRFYQELSEALVMTAQPLGYLRNAEGLVEFPATYAVSAGKFALLPDLEYIAKKMAVSKGKELLMGIIEKVTGKNGAAEEDER